jgi:sugar phosphate isomerase/epimerase
MTQIGLQLFTLRDDCARDFRSTLHSVADLGYEGVEFCDLYGHLPETVRDWLDELGLVAVGRHAGLPELESGLGELAQEMKALECKRAAVAWIDPPESGDDARAVVARIAAAAERARDLGIHLGFHNHWGELESFDGVSTLDLLRALPSDLLWLELDLGWVWSAGADPVEQLELTRGRCPLVHVKDLRKGTEYCPVGDGDVGYDRVLPATVEAGVEWLVVEQDVIEGDAISAVARSLDAVRGLMGVAT